MVTVLLEKWFFDRKRSRDTYYALCVVVIGVALATLGEMDFTATGLVLTFLGMLLSSLKGLTTNVLLVGNLLLHPFDLLRRMAILSFIQCIFIAHYTGELSRYYNCKRKKYNLITFTYGS